MPIQITAPVPTNIPTTLNRIAIVRRPIDRGAAWEITLSVFHGATGKGHQHTVVVQNGLCSAIKKNDTATEWSDLITAATSPSVADGYTQIETIMDGPGTKNAKNDAILTALLAMGVIDASLTGTVV